MNGNGFLAVIPFCFIIVGVEIACFLLILTRAVPFWDKGLLNLGRALLFDGSLVGRLKAGS